MQRLATLGNGAVTGPAPVPVRLGRWFSRPGWAATLALAASLLIFGLYPELDIWFSRLFWSPDTGWAGERQDVVLALYHGVPWAGRALLLALALTWLVGLARPAWLPRMYRRTAALLLGSAVFGQGLLIDVALKDHWGRQRPRDTVVFNGTQPFQVALHPGGQCKSNCSFVSGHASSGFYLLGFGLLAAPALRRRWMFAALVAGGVIGLGRISQGGHFLSDVVFSFFAVWLSTHAVLAAMRALDRVRARRRRRMPGPKELAQGAVGRPNGRQ
jgi:lipid A 4'-phosphatase